MKTIHSRKLRVGHSQTGVFLPWHHFLGAQRTLGTKETSVPGGASCPHVLMYSYPNFRMSSCPHVLISSCPPVLPVTLAILRFSPEEGVVAFRNPYGKVWQWRREPCIPVTAYPDYLDYLNLSGLEGALAPPMGCPRGSRLQKVTSGGSSQWACSGVKVRKEYKKSTYFKIISNISFVL